MELFINKVISSVLEIIVLALVPFIWWLITARKKETFFSWIGLKKIDGTKGKSILKISGIVEIGFILLSIFILYAIRNVEGMATSDFTGLGIKALPAILVYALFNTALPEEILFRGFLLKRISKKFGFSVANYVQCIIFGLIHGVMFFSQVGTIKGLIITCFTMSIAWCMGYINEKKADGSILPGVGIHAVANIFSGLVSAFTLI